MRSVAGAEEMLLRIRALSEIREAVLAARSMRRRRFMPKVGCGLLSAGETREGCV